MSHKYTCLLVGVGIAVLLSQPSTAWAQAGPNLVIAMSHNGNFTVGVNGVYTIVVSNAGWTASSGQIGISVYQPTGSFTYVSQVGAGWSCSFHVAVTGSIDSLTCATDGVIAPGGSTPPISWIVVPRFAGTITNTVEVYGGGGTGSSITDLTIVVAAVPTLPEWAMIALTALLALAGVAALRRRTT
jgi:hypothetical protein